MKTNKFVYYLKQTILIFVAALSSAVSLEVFLLPSNVVAGGLQGISSILDLILTNLQADKWFFSAGIWVLALNLPIVIYCFCNFKRRFAIKTTLYVVFLGVSLVVLRLLGIANWVSSLVEVDGTTSDKVMYTLLGGALHGVSLPMLLAQNASTGGTDIVGLIVQKHARKSSRTAMRIILLTNLLILLGSSIAWYCVSKKAVEAMDLFVYSVAAMFIAEFVQETIFKGFSSAVELEITTEKREEMIEKLREGLKHGVTAIKVEGGYSHQEKSLILCVINKSQLILARRIINSVDPNAFAYVERVKEVIGKGFANKEIELENEE